MEEGGAKIAKPSYFNGLSYNLLINSVINGGGEIAKPSHFNGFSY